MNRHNLLEAAIGELVQHPPDVPRAIGLLTILRLQPEPEAEPEAPKMLPPMVGASGKVKSKDVPCPACKAKPGSPCFRLTSRGPHGKPTGTPLVMGDGRQTYHKRRSGRAKALSS